jgi:hypothetical protein
MKHSYVSSIFQRGLNIPWNNDMGSCLPVWVIVFKFIEYLRKDKTPRLCPGQDRSWQLPRHSCRG